MGRSRQELVLVAPSRFASPDGSISMQLRPGDDGNDIVLGYRRP